MKRETYLWVMALLGLMVLGIAVERPGAETTDCTAIPSLPYTISTQGIYCLKSNLSTSITAGNAITINTNNVVIDLNGFKIGGLGAGPLTTAYGIYAFGRQNITIRNGTVRGFRHGITLGDESPFTTSQGHIIEDIRADLNVFSGMEITGRGNIIRNNQVITTVAFVASEAHGIVVTGPGNRVLNNDVYETRKTGAVGDAMGIYLQYADDCVVEGNRVGNTAIGSEWATGIYIVNSADVLVSNNRIAAMDYGVRFLNGGTGKYRDTLTSGVTTPYTGGDNAGNNN